MTDRIRTILAAGDAAGLPEIARILALDSDLSPEAAETVFAAAKKDIAAAQPQPAVGVIQTASAQNAPTGPFHTIGVPDRVGGDPSADVKASWARSVEMANARF